MGIDPMKTHLIFYKKSTKIQLSMKRLINQHNNEKHDFTHNTFSLSRFERNNFKQQISGHFTERISTMLNFVDPQH